MYNHKLIYFSPFTHPRHYAEDSLRLLEEGDGVEGSSGFPGSVCLHPLHGPPSPSSPLAGSKARELCGATDTEYPLLLLLSPLRRGTDARLSSARSLQPSLVSVSLFIYLLFNLPIPCGPLSRPGQEDAVGYVGISDDALLPFNAGAGGERVNALPMSRLGRSAPHLRTLPGKKKKKTRSGSAHVLMEGARLSALHPPVS